MMMSQQHKETGRHQACCAAPQLYLRSRAEIKSSWISSLLMASTTDENQQQQQLLLLPLLLYSSSPIVPGNTL
jgi:hypothetical protein